MIGVFVVGSDGIARFRIVTVGKSHEGQTEILSGLSEDEEIAASETHVLQDGSRVR
jgi:hypothetical protein